MRISDWSSDVCSSDLIGEIVGQIEHAAQPFGETNRLDIEIELLKVEFLFELDIAGGVIGQAAAIKVRDGLDHLLGTLRLVRQHECRKRIERVEQEMRIDLIAQRSQLGGLGRVDRKSTRLNSSH